MGYAPKLYIESLLPYHNIIVRINFKLIHVEIYFKHPTLFCRFFHYKFWRDKNYKISINITHCEFD